MCRCWIRYIIVTIFLTLGLYFSSSAMEDPTNEATDLDQEFQACIRYVEDRCSELMKCGEQASSDTDRIPLYEEALNSLKIMVDPYKANFKDVSFTNDDRIFAIETIYRISQTLFKKWTTTVNINAREAQEVFWPTFQCLCNINLFTLSHLTFFPHEKLTSIQPRMAMYNFLVDVTTLFANRITYLSKDEINGYYHFASLCYDGVKDSPEYKEQAERHINIIKSQKEESEKGVRKIKLGKKGERFRKQQYYNKKKQLLEQVESAQKGFQTFNPTTTFLEVIALKNKASVIWESTRNLEEYLNAQRDSYQALVKLEENLARKLGIQQDPQHLTVEDYTKIYAELAKAVTFEAAKTRLPEFMIISQNCSDLDKTLLRLRACAKVLGSSGDDFDSMPNSLKHIFAIVKYYQGEPQYWDQLNEKLEKERQKKREAGKKKKNAQMVQAIKDDQELRKQKADAQITNEKAFTQTPQSQAKSLTISSNPSEPYVEYAEVQTGPDKGTTAAVKKAARAAIKKLEEKKEARDNRPAGEPKTAAVVVAAAPASSDEAEEPKAKCIAAEELLSGHNLKLFDSLFSEAPKLTSDEAVQLLDACHLTVDKTGGKGSHTKCTLNAGEIIKDKHGKVIWICPNLGEESMMIVPKWNGKDIPDYMVKSLRYILEKIGIKPED